MPHEQAAGVSADTPQPFKLPLKDVLLTAQRPNGQDHINQSHLRYMQQCDAATARNASVAVCLRSAARAQVDTAAAHQRRRARSALGCPLPLSPRAHPVQVRGRSPCRQLQELRVALGWKERFASPLAFFVLDVGIGKPKQPPPLAVMRARVGRHNDDLALPELPVRLPHLV